MKLGIGPYYFTRYPGKEGYERMRSHGYDYVDFDHYANTEGGLYPEDEAEFLRVTETLRDKFCDAGYTVWQIHGPWRHPQDGTEEDRAERFDKMSMALRAASILGAKYMAIHPIMPFGWEKHTDAEAEEMWRINIDFFTRLAAVGEKYGVYVCLENMPFPDLPISSAVDIMRLVKAVDHPYLRVCLDTGHANVVKPDPAEAVRIIGKDYLKILHVHGNDGTQDSHLNPGHPDDTVDWQSFTAALKKIDFDGVVNLETFPKPQGPDGKAPEDIEINLATMAKKIAGM